MKFFLLFLLFFTNLYAIVTIKPVNIGDKPGRSGLIKGSFETKRGNSDVDNYTAGARFQYDNNVSYVIWSDFTFSYGKSSGETNTNQTYSHIRYIHKLYKKSIDWETFVQLETNKFTNVKYRNLVGLGLRFYAKKSHFGELYLGVGSFYENIAYTTNVDPKEHNIRLNNYIAYTNKFTKESFISYILYYQPKIDEINDYIFSNAFELNVLVYKQLSLNITITYNYDAKPAIGIKREDIAQKTSFVYKF
jgi:hypothetical protein